MNIHWTSCAAWVGANAKQLIFVFRLRCLIVHWRTVSGFRQPRLNASSKSEPKTSCAIIMAENLADDLIDALTKIDENIEQLSDVFRQLIDRRKSNDIRFKVGRTLTTAYKVGGIVFAPFTYGISLAATAVGVGSDFVFNKYYQETVNRCNQITREHLAKFELRIDVLKATETKLTQTIEGLQKNGVEFDDAFLIALSGSDRNNAFQSVTEWEQVPAQTWCHSVQIYQGILFVMFMSFKNISLLLK